MVIGPLVFISGLNRLNNRIEYVTYNPVTSNNFVHYGPQSLKILRFLRSLIQKIEKFHIIIKDTA